MKILCFGSLNVDYVYSLDHFVKPGETTASNSRAVNAGGKGLNQSVALASSGASVYHAGRIGKDGLFLKELLESRGVGTEFVHVSEERPSGHAVIQVDKKGENCIILYPGENHNIDEDFIISVLSRFESGDVVVLQNEINNIPLIMEKAFENNIKVVFNPSPVTDDIKNYPLSKVSLFVVNETEGKALTGNDTPEEILDSFGRLYPDADVLLTLGGDGSVFRAKDGKIFKQGIYKVPVVDTTGAGDTFLGYFVGLTSLGHSTESALDTAAKASSIAVSRKGAAASIPHISEIK